MFSLCSGFDFDYGARRLGRGPTRPPPTAGAWLPPAAREGKSQPPQKNQSATTREVCLGLVTIRHSFGSSVSWESNHLLSAQMKPESFLAAAHAPPSMN